jgi:hypothetical protein
MAGTWVYTRQQERLRVERHESAQGVELILTSASESQRKAFDHIEDLIVYHALLEHALTEAGWRFERYTPERREKSERRATARPTPDRRGLIRRLIDRLR